MFTSNLEKQIRHASYNIMNKEQRLCLQLSVCHSDWRKNYRIKSIIIIGTDRDTLVQYIVPEVTHIEKLSAVLSFNYYLKRGKTAGYEILKI